MKSDISDPLSAPSNETLASYQASASLFTQNVASPTTYKREAEDGVGNAPQDINEYRLNFGKHKGKTLEEVWRRDTPYIDWLIKARIGKTRPDLREALIPYLTPSSSIESTQPPKRPLPQPSAQPEIKATAPREQNVSQNSRSTALATSLPVTKSFIPPDLKMAPSQFRDDFTKEDLRITGKDAWKYFQQSHRNLEVLPKAYHGNTKGATKYWLYHAFELVKSEFSEGAANRALIEFKKKSEEREREIVENLDYGSMTRPRPRPRHLHLPPRRSTFSRSCPF